MTLNVGSKNDAFLLTERTSIVNQMFSLNLNFLVSSLFQKECVTRTYQLAYKCRQLKNDKIRSASFWENSVKLDERSSLVIKEKCACAIIAHAILENHVLPAR